MSSLRIVSLLPSATEILCALGLTDQLVGISHECDHPDAITGLPVLTAARLNAKASSAEIDRQVRALMNQGLSVYDIHEERLRALSPDLIVTQDTCQVCAVSLAEVQEAARRLVGKPCQVLSLSPLTVGDVLGDIRRVGAAAGVGERAEGLVQSLTARLDQLRERTRGRSCPRVVVLEWIDPPMVAGHWTPELIRAAGGEPLLGPEGRPTGPVPFEKIREADPDVLLLIPCGFKIPQTQVDLTVLAGFEGFSELRAVKNDRVWAIDGNAYFNRPGPRLVDSAEIAAAALWPGEFEEYRSDVLWHWPQAASR